MLKTDALFSTFVKTIIHFFVSGYFIVGVLQLIGYQSLSADNRLGMFDRRSLKRLISKSRSQVDDAPAVRGLTRHAPFQSLHW